MQRCHVAATSLHHTPPAKSRRVDDKRNHKVDSKTSQILHDSLHFSGPIGATRVTCRSLLRGYFGINRNQHVLESLCVGDCFVASVWLQRRVISSAALPHFAWRGKATSEDAFHSLSTPRTVLSVLDRQHF